MNPVLTITIDSVDYVRADRALRVSRDEAKPGVRGYVGAIIEARRTLGFSMHPADLFYDYKDGDFNSIVRT